jgi:hypothetical protein
MKKTVAWLMLLTVTALFAISVTPALAHTEGDPQWNPLFAGSPHYYGEPGPKDPDWWWTHKTEVGSVFVWNNETHLSVMYDTWVGMHETHVAVAEDFEDIPQTKSGNPKVGKFPFKHEGLGGAMTDMYTIPHDFDAGTELIIAAHAALCNGETAWADCGGPDAYFPGNNWATFFYYTVQ